MLSLKEQILLSFKEHESISGESEITGLHNMRDPGILDPRHFFCQALFDNLSRFMCFLGTFLEKKVAIYVFILAKCRDLCTF